MIMATEIRVPALGESITEATVGKWFKETGEAVKQDEPLVEQLAHDLQGINGLLRGLCGKTVHQVCICLLYTSPSPRD